MKKLFVPSLCAIALLMTGCVAPMKGNIMAAVTLDHVASDPAVDNTVRPIKRGESKATAVIMFGTGDASITAAMRNGNITKVHHVDYTVKNILFFYSEVLTVVYGE